MTQWHKEVSRQISKIILDPYLRISSDSPEGAWRLKRNEWSEETYRPLPAGELLQGTSVKPPEMWPESALTNTSEGEAPSHAEWKELA